MELRVGPAPSEPLRGDRLEPLSGAGLLSVFLRAWLVGASLCPYFHLYVACSLQAACV